MRLVLAHTLADPDVPLTNPDLEWFYRWSAAAVGFHSQSMEAGGGTRSAEPQSYSESQLEAGAKQGRIKCALRELSPHLQGILEACYEPRPHAVQLRHAHGIAAGWVARCLRRKDVTTETLHAEVSAAHFAFELVYGGPPRTRKERAARWLSDGAEREAAVWP